MVDLFGLASLNLLLFYVKNIIHFFDNSGCINEEVNCTEPFPSVRVPWLSFTQGHLRQFALLVFLVKLVPGRGPEQRESGKTVLYLLIINIILISYIIIKLLIKRRTIPAETGNRTP